MQFKIILLLPFLLSACVTQILVNRYDENQIKIPIEDTNNIDFDPDIYLSAPQIIRKNGYKSESHVVKTNDGYLLTVHRIPENKYGILGQQPVFLQHGLLSSSDDWVITENNSLAFILSDLGFDVWLGNSRGSKFSNAHVSTPPDSDEFWNFSFHEMGIFDLPAVLSYIVNITNENEKIIYIGHSMGTTMFYVMASKFPEFTHSTVKVMISLAPVAFMTYIKSPIRYLAPFANDVNWIAKTLGVHQFLPNNEIMKFLSWECRLSDISKTFCEQVMFLICGFDKEEISELMGIVLAVTCQMSKKESEETITVCYNLLLDIPAESSNKIDRIIRTELILLAQEATDQGPSFSAAGFFPIDYSMLFGLIGTVTSYVVVIIQVM